MRWNIECIYTLYIIIIIIVILSVACPYMLFSHLVGRIVLIPNEFQGHRSKVTDFYKVRNLSLFEMLCPHSPTPPQGLSGSRADHLCTITSWNEFQGHQSSRSKKTFVNFLIILHADFKVHQRPI